jgi:hypothetical protein
MCNGFLKFVVGSDPRAVRLREEFVIKVVPMINPDGVYRGHYRSDTYGVNLNRVYANPSQEQAPTIYGIRKVVEMLASRIYLYIDLHAHAGKRGIFLFGNYSEFSKCLETFLFPKLIQLN